MRGVPFVSILALAVLFSAPLAAGGDGDGFRVRGTCRSRDGEALSGVRVTLVDPDTGARLTTATSNERGTFVATVDAAAAAARQRPHGGVVVRAEHNGNSRREQLVRAGARRVALVLPRSSPRRAVVVDPEGNPLASVRATAFGEAGANYYRRTVRSDVGGRIVIDDAASDVRQLHVEHTGFYPETFVLQGDADERIRLRRLPMRRVRGRVLDTEERPVGAATVYGGVGIRTRTNADGRFTIDVLARSVSLGAAGTRSGAGFVAAGKSNYRHGYARLDGDEPVEIRLERSAPLRARLLDSTGSPLRHARVYLKSGHGQLLSNWVPGESLVARPDAAGRIAFPSPLPGPMSIEIYRPGRVAYAVAVPSREDEAEWVVRLPEEFRVSGRVVMDGGPICGARVEAVGDGTEGMTARARLSNLQSLAHTFTDADGHFAFAMPGETLAVQAFADGIRTAAIVVDARDPSRSHEVNELRLAAEHLMVGAVYDDLGRRVQTGSIRCIAVDDDSDSHETIVRSDGSFHLPRSRSRAFRIRYRGQGHIACESIGWPGDPIRIATSRLSGAAAIEIGVDRKGVEAQVRVVNLRFPEITKTVSLRREDASATAAGLPFGTYRVTVESPDCSPSSAVVVASPGSTRFRCDIALDAD